MRDHGFIQIVTSIAAIGLLVFATSSYARCRFPSLEEEFKEASQVYEATLILVEYIKGETPAGLDADEAQELTPDPHFRFVLDVGHVYKGTPRALIEKNKLANVHIISGRPLNLEELPITTRLLIFEPNWDSGCSRSTVIDEKVDRDLLPALRALGSESVDSN